MAKSLRTTAPDSVLQFIFNTARDAVRPILFNKRFAADDEDVAQHVLIKIAPKLVSELVSSGSHDVLTRWSVRDGKGLHPNLPAYVRLCARRRALSLLRTARRADDKQQKVAAEAEPEAKRLLCELLTLRPVLKALDPKDRQLLVADAYGLLEGASPRVRKALSRARRRARDRGRQLC